MMEGGKTISTINIILNKKSFVVNQVSAEEEYIMAMRINANRDDSEAWRERRSNPLPSGPGGYPINRRKTLTKGLIPMTDDHASKVLASLVPDEIIFNVNDYSPRPYNVCLLFGDVSG